LVWLGEAGKRRRELGSEFAGVNGGSGSGGVREAETGRKWTRVLGFRKGAKGAPF